MVQKKRLSSRVIPKFRDLQGRSFVQIRVGEFVLDLSMLLRKFVHHPLSMIHHPSIIPSIRVLFFTPFGYKFPHRLTNSCTKTSNVVFFFFGRFGNSLFFLSVCFYPATGAALWLVQLGRHGGLDSLRRLCQYLEGGASIGVFCQQGSGLKSGEALKAVGWFWELEKNGRWGFFFIFLFPRQR